MRIEEAEARMLELIPLLNEASSDYYTGAEESQMTDQQYDNLYTELANLEEKFSIRLTGSPTVNVGYKEPDEEGRVAHYKPVLSLKDTKSIDDLLHFLGEEEGILSWKLDGISIVLYYANGKLQQALSRGDGHYGKDITRNVKMMRDVPERISVTTDVIIRGEGCMKLKDFDMIKQTKDGEQFKNPRNLAAGLINATKTPSTLLKQLSFVAHTAIFLGGKTRRLRTRFDQLEYINNLGFNVVPHFKVANFELKNQIDACTYDIQFFEYPVDGLVLTLNDIRLGEAKGFTAKFPKHSMAFKWPDETAETTVTGMKWSVSKTGLITPVVQLEPVFLDGTEVKQANLHSLKIFESLSIGIGDTVKIFKANKIIPEVEENLTRSKTEEYPKQCPVCGANTKVVETDKTLKLYCSRDVPWKCV